MGPLFNRKKMKRITPLLLTILLITSAPSILASNFPLSILDDVQTTSDPQSSNSLGLGFAYGQNIYTGVDNIIQPFPLFNLSMHNFFLKGDELGYYTYKDPGVSVAVILKPTFAGYSASDSDALDGMSDTSYLLNTGLQMQYRLMPLSFTVEALHDVTGRSTGNTLSGELATIFPIDDQRFTVIPSVTAVWQSSDITNYYYGVSGSEVTASRPEYSPAGATTIHYGLTLKYRVSDHLGTTFGYTLTQLPRAISDSPIVSRSTSSSLLAGASYIF
ncbi:MAG: MipA/OmpV family protein [Gammaproteobacteria bacterium]|nr:MipA/OmpV family protein [Gammaproteobacteria bacterium]